MSEAIQLLQRWLDYYEGKASSFGLKGDTVKFLKQQEEEAKRWKPTPEEEERMNL